MEISRSLGVRGFSDEMDVSSVAQSEGLSIEEAGRQVRYNFLVKLARQFDTKYVLTGHNANDQVETILMHFLRGSGMEGLRGMPTAGPMPGSADITLIRPLLRVSREEIEAYCREHHLNPMYDESNQDAAFYRNRLRHQLIPLLEEYNPQIHEQLRQLSMVISDENKLIEDIVHQVWLGMIIDQATTWLKLDLDLFKELSVAVQRRILRKAVLTLKPGLRDVGFRAIEQARSIAMTADVGIASSLPDRINMMVGYNGLSISLRDTVISADDSPQLEGEAEISLPVPGEIELKNGWRIQTVLVEDVDCGRYSPMMTDGRHF